MDWNVTVQLDNSQIKDIRIHDVTQREDAVKMALSQTGASSVISAMPMYSASSSKSSSNQPRAYYSIGNELNGFEGLFMLIGGLMFLGGLFLPGLFMLGFALIISAAVLAVLRNVKDDLF
jgi:hypothetical protein